MTARTTIRLQRIIAIAAIGLTLAGADSAVAPAGTNGAVAAVAQVLSN